MTAQSVEPLQSLFDVHAFTQYDFVLTLSSVHEAAQLEPLVFSRGPEEQSTVVPPEELLDVLPLELVVLDVLPLELEVLDVDDELEEPRHSACFASSQLALSMHDSCISVYFAHRRVQSDSGLPSPAHAAITDSQRALQFVAPPPELVELPPVLEDDEDVQSPLDPLLLSPPLVLDDAEVAVPELVPEPPELELPPDEVVVVVVVVEVEDFASTPACVGSLQVALELLQADTMLKATAPPATLSMALSSRERAIDEREEAGEAVIPPPYGKVALSVKLCHLA